MTDGKSSGAGRREIPSRTSGWAKAVTRWLAGTAVTPNQISYLGVLAAVLAGLALWLGHGGEGVLRWLALIAAAGLIFLRLLCNMFDGLLAVEAGKGGADGPFWNEVPDRAADIAILLGAGYGAGLPELGWAAALAALATAYIRAVGSALGQPADFGGPMAKPHRMAAIMAGAVLAAFEPLLSLAPVFLLAAVWVFALGAALTFLLRAMRLRNRLAAGG